MGRGDVLLHPEKGLNPRITVCQWCGADTGIAMLGIKDTVYECKGCGYKHVGGRPRKACQCGDTRWSNVGSLPEHARLPGGLCGPCKEKNDACKAAVAAGGVAWRCTTCNSQGAFTQENPISRKVREQMKIYPPNPCGLEFSKGDCPACQAKNAGVRPD